MPLKKKDKAALKRASELAKEIESALEDLDEDEFPLLPEWFKKLSKLKKKIDEARENPETMDGDKAKELVTEMIMFIPEQLPLPKPLKKALRTLAEYIGLLLGAAWSFAQKIAWNRFIKRLRFAPRPLKDEDVRKAAKEAAPTTDTERWILARWKLEQLKLVKKADKKEALKAIE